MLATRSAPDATIDRCGADTEALIKEARQHVLERAGSGDEELARAVGLLVTEAGEFKLSGILDAALGGDRRKLDRFFAGGGDLAARVQEAHGLQDGDTISTIETGFCAGLAREIGTLRAVHEWLGRGTKSDLEAAERLSAVLADIDNSFATLGVFLLTK